MSATGPLSWQQAGMFRRQGERGRDAANCVTAFPLPRGMTASEVQRALARVADSEDALRIVAADASGVRYADRVVPVLHRRRADTRADAERVAYGAASALFDRDAGPLWDATFVEGPGGAELVAVFDHLVADARSLALLKDAVLSGTTGVRGRYREWVSWQRSRFPSEPTGAAPAEREFWARHLDGTCPDRSTPLPFVTRGGPGGLVRFVSTTITAPPGRVAAAAGASRATPFVLVLGAVAAALARSAATDDVTVRTVSSGRTTVVADTFGWFADCLPLRLRDAALADPRRAVAVARAAWLAALRHQSAPWDYLLAELGSDGEVAGAQQVLVNLLPASPWRVVRDDVTDRVSPGFVRTIQVTVMPAAGDRLRVEAAFDPVRVDPVGARELVAEVAAALRAVVGADEDAVGAPGV